MCGLFGIVAPEAGLLDERRVERVFSLLNPRALRWVNLIRWADRFGVELD